MLLNILLAKPLKNSMFQHSATKTCYTTHFQLVMGMIKNKRKKPLKIFGSKG
jgi:hypothetical protein